jgi:predicted ATPase
LLHYLLPKKLLLVVDNLEHLLAGACLLSEILSHAQQVTLLATSRERLHLQEEWCYPVQRLAYPAGNDDDTTALTESGAVELFIQRARQAFAGFAPSGTDMAAIGRICRLVEGWPLALELAASWTRTLSCREIAAEIERSLDFLTTSLQNVPERHRSLRAVFEQTWSRLPAPEQTALAKLAVFQSSFSRAEALETAGMTLSLLMSLVDKALVSRSATGQYKLHGLLDQFAREKLAANAGNHERVANRSLKWPRIQG